MPPVESMRRNPFGAVFCDEHGRWEPTHLTKHRERCHQPAIEGTDQCRMHPGQKLDAVKAKGQAAVARQRFRDVDPSEYLDPSDVLLWTVTLARVDLADYRAELREVAAKGDVPTEQLDRLSRLQIDAARMAKMAIDAGIEERRIRAAEALGDRLIQLVRGLLSAMGHDPDDPKVAAIARSHLELMTGSAA